MTTYKFGDIILVPFPFTDQTSTKKRPAVVISSEEYNSSRADLIIMAITSRLYQMDKLGE
jgi:mRNA interferase MazF